MTHEPECGYAANATWEGCMCKQLRAAYKRGRDQIATAVTTVIFDFPESRRTLSVQRLIDDVVHAVSTNYVSQPGEQPDSGNGGEQE